MKNDLDNMGDLLVRQIINNMEGQVYGVSLRELAEDLGLPYLWRRWTLCGFIDASTAKVGCPNLRPFAFSSGPCWVLEEATRGGTGGRFIGPVARGPYFPCTIVLIHVLLDAHGASCESLAALSTRFLVEGRAHLEGP